MQGQQSIDGRQYDVVVLNKTEEAGCPKGCRDLVQLLSLAFDLRSVVGVRKLVAVIPKNENPGVDLGIVSHLLL